VDFKERPLLVLALGGNALSPPLQNSGYELERQIIHDTGKIIDQLIKLGYRLVIVHGNGPQVGRLMSNDPAEGNLDIHIAQTQGELGYLLAAASSELVVPIVTRCIVDSELAPAIKPVGPWRTGPPVPGVPAVFSDKGWRRLVASPRPTEIPELAVIAALSRSHHVIAGGGGGIPMTASGQPVSGVVDKDWIASFLAIRLQAEALIFATDVEYVFENFGQTNQTALPKLTISAAEKLLEGDQIQDGSMAPKLASALDYVRSIGRSARICHLQQIIQALHGDSGTLLAGAIGPQGREADADRKDGQRNDNAG